MFVWLSMLLLIVFSGTVINTYSPRGQKRFLVFSAFILIVVLGSRNAAINYGSDLNNYYRLYAGAMELDWKHLIQASTMETGYLFVNYILAHIVKWNQFIIYAQAAFCIGSSMYFIRRNTTNVYHAVIYFICLGPFQFFLTGFRQSIAICICFFAYEMAKQKKLFKFILLILIACSMHQTAIVFAPAYILINLNGKRIYTALVMAFIFVSSFFVENLMQWGNDVFEKEYTAKYIGNILGGVIPLVIYAVALLLIFMREKKRMDDGNATNQMSRMLLVGAGIYAMRYQALVLERISFYYTPIVVPLLANDVQEIKGSDNRNFIKVLGVVLCMLLFIWRVQTQIGDYTFFWNG